MVLSLAAVKRFWLAIDFLKGRQQHGNCSIFILLVSDGIFYLE